MLTVEYVESVDPLIRLIQTDPGAVFAKPHMAYLLFLFGEADTETAEWIRRNLRPLDSLLGPDIAGAVFVKSFKVRALVRSYYTSRFENEKIQDGNVDLRDIRHVESIAMTTPMFNEYGEASKEARRSMEALTATTYASDEIARSLGVVGELPCIAFLDAMPGPIRCLRLNADTLPNVLTLIRNILGRLTTAPGYTSSRLLLSESNSAGKEIGRLRQAAKDNKLAQRETLAGLQNPLISQLASARAYLIEGSARKFRHELRQSSLPKGAVEPAIERALMNASSLTHVCRTIRGVSWYVETTQPLGDSDRSRLATILSSHAAEILGTGTRSPDELSEPVIHECLAALENAKTRVIAEIWGDLPQSSDLERDLAEAINRATHEPLKEREVLTVDAQRATANLEDILHELATAPRITDVFDTVIERDHDEHARNVELGPEMMERILKAVTSGAVRIVGRDIYIGTNIGAMGPFAHAERTMFG